MPQSPKARPAATADRGSARGSRRGRGSRTCAGGQCGIPASSGGHRGPRSGCGCRRGPGGPPPRPRPPLEDVSGKAHVLPAGAEQDNLGGARALPEPVSGGLRRLWLRVVSVIGPGAVVAGWPFKLQSQACPHGSVMRQAEGIYFGGGHRCPLDSPSSTPFAPCSLHPAHPGRWSTVCRTPVHSGRWCWSSTLVRTLRIPFLEFALPGHAPGEAFFWEEGGLPAGVEQEDPFRRSAHPGPLESALSVDKPRELPGEEGQSPTRRLRSSEQN